MKYQLMTAAAALALLATTAQASTPVPLVKSGYWETNFVANNADNEPMCLMKTHWTFNSGAYGDLFFKWTGSTGLFIHISKSTWNLPVGQEVPLSLWLDKGERPATGQAKKTPAGLTIVEVGIDEDAMVGLMNDVAEANEVWLTFPKGSEKPWGGKMVGSRIAKRWFAACVAKLRGDDEANATQPVAPNAAEARTRPTQPMPPVQPTDDTRKRAKKDDGSV